MGKSFCFKKNIIIIMVATLLALGAGGTAVALGISHITQTAFRVIWVPRKDTFPR